MNTGERKVICKVLDRMETDGCYFAVDYGDGEQSSGTVAVILKELGACDQEWVNVYRNGTYIGQLFLVYGNAPDEVICDYSISLEQWVN